MNKKLAPGQVWGKTALFRYHIKSLDEYYVRYDVFRRMYLDTGDYSLYVRGHRYPINQFLISGVHLIKDVRKSSYDDPDYANLWI